MKIARRTRVRFQNDIAGLRAKQADARRKLKELAEADKAAAADLKAQVAAARDELRAAFESATKRY